MALQKESLIQEQLLRIVIIISADTQHVTTTVRTVYAVALVVKQLVVLVEQYMLSAARAVGSVH
jgi:hypothetical protein